MLVFTNCMFHRDFILVLKASFYHFSLHAAKQIINLLYIMIFAQKEG